ncbi:hypothetical protein DERF_006753 [Dermatophagoides farinae]|uniref:Chitin-binding type-2 domain-containing protein n=1 Tax=Dermatophagoides farinae TaxID=6954 RepID=A0A922HXS2_DERFA|nr:hypothetical protein DERF_006753 [Dermatophagoides farinae]
MSSILSPFKKKIFLSRLIIIICSIRTSLTQNRIRNNDEFYNRRQSSSMNKVSLDRLLKKTPAILEESSVYLKLKTNSNGFSRKSSDMIETQIAIPSNLISSKSNLINTKFRSTKSLDKFLSSIRFNCTDRPEGYYADIERDCRTFHYCKRQSRKFTFNCPGSSIFNQKELSCENNLNNPRETCLNSTKFFFINSILYDHNNNNSINKKSLNTELNFRNETKNLISITTTNISNQTKLLPPSLKYRQKISSNHSSSMMIASTKTPLTMQIDKPKWYNHRQQSYFIGKNQANDLPEHSFNKYSYNNDKMTTTFRPLIIKKYNTSSANNNNNNNNSNDIKVKLKSNNNNKYIINAFNEIQSEFSPPSTTTSINSIKPITINTNLSTQDYFLHHKPLVQSMFLNDYNFFQLPFGGGDYDNHSSSYNGSPFHHLSIQQPSLPLTLPTLRESSKPKSKMDKFLPFSLTNIKDRLLRNWNQNFFSKKVNKDSKKIRSMDSRKMDFLFPQAFKRFRSLFSRSNNTSDGS